MFPSFPITQTIVCAEFRSTAKLQSVSVRTPPLRLIVEETVGNMNHSKK